MLEKQLLQSACFTIVGRSVNSEVKLPLSEDVDNGTTTMDHLEMERERGITITSAVESPLFLGNNLRLERH